MDAERFDSLTRRLVDPQSRRRLLRGMGVGAGAATLTALGVRPSAAAPNACAQACAFEPKGPRQAACKQACKQCGGNLNQVCFGNQIICCAGGVCCFNEQTGNTVCTTCGPDEFPNESCACVPLATCPSGERAENCSAGVETNCGPDCALAVDADGGCACVERFCPGIGCASGEDCESGPCVSVPGCCPETQFCGVPCGASGAGSRSRGRTKRWSER